MIERFVEAFYVLPDYFIQTLNGKYMIPAIVAAILLLFSAFFTNKLADIIRGAYVVCAAGLFVFAYLTSRYPLMITIALSILFLGVVRLIRYIWVNVRQDRINSKIEAKALAKAKKRRGSWQNKKGYSGEAKPLVVDEPVQTLTEEEREAAEAAKDALLEEDSELTEAEELEIDYMNRKDVTKYVDMLKELKAVGILTEEEYTKKQAELFSKLG